MTRDQIIKKFARKYEYTNAQSKELLREVVEFVGDMLKSGESLDIYGFGKIYVTDVTATKTVNPKTKEEVLRPQYRIVRFKAGNTLKKYIDGKVDTLELNGGKNVPDIGDE